MVQRFRILIIVSLVSLILSQPIMALEITAGVTPNMLIVDNALSGTTIEKEFTLVKNKGESNMLVEISSTGNISDWLMVLPKKKFVFYAGEEEKSITTRIVVPDSAKNEKREGKIHISFLSEGAVRDGLSMQLEVEIDCFVQSTQQENDHFIIQNPRFIQDESGDMLLSYTVDNVGNVISGPDFVKMFFVDAMNVTHSYFQKISSEGALAFTKGKFQEKVYTDLKQGHYSYTIKFYRKGKVVYESRKNIRVDRKQILPEKIFIFTMFNNLKHIFLGVEY